NEMREAMFNKAPSGHNLLNTACNIYQEIAKIAKVVRTNEPLRFGRMYFRQISGDEEHFGLPFGNAYTLAFSRVLYPEEVLVAYNVENSKRHDSVIVDAALHPAGSTLEFQYGGSGTVRVRVAGDRTCLGKLELAPHQFVTL